MGQLQARDYFCKEPIIGSQPCPLISVLLVPQHSWAVSTETVWPTKPKIYYLALYRKCLLTPASYRYIGFYTIICCFSFYFLVKVYPGKAQASPHQWNSSPQWVFVSSRTKPWVYYPTTCSTQTQLPPTIFIILGFVLDALFVTS